MTTNETTHDAMMQHMLGQIMEQPQVDYWCRDCQDWWKAPQIFDPHADDPPCPKCGGKNTYEAYTD